MADDDKDSLAYFPSYQIPLPGIKAAVSGVQQGYGSGTENDQTVLDLAVAGPWREETDPQTGSTFYYNAITLESRWERPADMAATGTGFNGTTAGPVLHPESQKLSSPRQQSQPKENASLVNLVPALMRAKRRWRALVDGNTGSTYYIDEATGVSQWEKPPPEDVTPSGDAIGKNPMPSSTQHRKEENNSLVRVVPALVRAKRKWRALVDDGTGSTYYVDEGTGVVQWDKPLEVDSGRSRDDEKTVDDPREDALDINETNLPSGCGENENDTRAASEMGDSIERVDDALVKPVAPENGTEQKPSGAAAEVYTDNKIQESGDGDQFLQRADSSSTLSTYGGELESLAKYVTGHSTTLERGAVVKLDLLKDGGGGEGGGGGDSIRDAGDDTLQSTGGLSVDNNRSTSESEIETDGENMSMHSKSSTHDFVAENTAPLFSVDAGTLPQNDYSSREQQQQVEPGKASTDGSSPSSTQSISQQHALDVLVDNSSQLGVACRVAGDDGVDVCPSTDKQRPSVSAKLGYTEVDAGITSTPNGFEEGVPGQQKQNKNSPPSPTSGDFDGIGGSIFKEASTENSGAVELLFKEVPAEASSSLSDMGHLEVPSAVLSGKDSKTNAVTPVEQNEGPRPSQDSVITATATMAGKTSSPFDTAAVAALALERLKAGMGVRRQKEASVKLQAQARGWAARRMCARLEERRETRRREEREAKQRAATAIQAMGRGRAGRSKAQQVKQLRTGLESQLARRNQDRSTTETSLEQSINHRDTKQLGDELDMESTVSRLSLEQNHHRDGNGAFDIGVTRETSIQLANGDDFGGRKEELHAQSHKAENTREGGDHHDSAEPAAIRWSEGEPPSREADQGGPGNDAQYLGQSQGIFSGRLSDYGGTDIRFESGPMGTIDEEGHQRNEHLWGGGEAEEAKHSVEASSEDDEGPLDETCDGAVFSSGLPIRKADVVQNAPGCSKNSDAVFDEESTGELVEDGADSNERRCDSSSRTSISSKTATPTEGGASSEMTVSSTDGDSKVLSEDDYSYPSRDQPSAKMIEEEWVEQHQQQPPEPLEMTARDQTTGAVDEYCDGNPSPADNDNTEHTRETSGGSEDGAEGDRAREGVYLDTTVPMERLEDLRRLVAAQAQATARAAMTAVGTDASKLETIQIRNIADRQIQAATTFREAIRHSIAVDTGDSENRSFSTSRASSCTEEAPFIPSERVEAEGVVYGQPVEDDVIEPSDQSRQIQDVQQGDPRNRNIYNDDVRQTAIDFSAADDLADTDITTGRAALILASDLSRLASRQGDAVCELLRVSSSDAAPSAGVLDPRKDPRKDPGVLDELAALGQAVGLQAKAVGLMEEVVVRTVHSRFDARVAARATRKEQAGRLAESLAEDVKLVAARHQHAARRMEAAPNPATARHVADDIRRLTLVQEQLAYKVQRFILSTSTALFNNNENGNGEDTNSPTDEVPGVPAFAEGQRHGANEEATRTENAVADIAAVAETKTGTVQERLGKFATAVVEQLRKGIDVGSIAAARAQAIRRGSQAGRLAAELRLIASGQVTASLVLAAAGEQLIADAMAEKPLPREYTLPSSARKRAFFPAGEKSGGKSQDDSSALGDGGQISQKQGQRYGISENIVVDVGVPAGEPEDEMEVTAGTGNDAAAGDAAPHDAESFLRAGSGFPSARTADNVASPSFAIEAAAGREEMVAAARIRSFLRRRRRQTRSGEMREAPVESISSSAVEPSSDQRSSDSTTEWFGVALHRLQREVNHFLLGDEQQDPASGGDSKASSLEDTGDYQAQELEMESNSVGARVSNADDDCCTDDQTAHNSTESSGYDNDEDWPTFPPVPLRARAPSLYTLPAPGSSTWKRKAHEDDGGDSGAVCSNRSTAAAGGEGGMFTKLGPDVVTRLSSARSVFCLRAADVLSAFSPPPPPRCSFPLGTVTSKSNEDFLGPRPSTAPEQTVRCADKFDYHGRGRLSSPDALRQRLRREAEDASRAGFGRPWLLSSHKKRVPTRHKQEQEQLSAFIRENNEARSARGGGGDGGRGRIEQERAKRWRVDFFGSWTPLGRRLAKRYDAGRAARRRRILGETDQFRARHVGRQLRSGAATNALEGVARALDFRLSVRRERRVPPTHVTDLLDIVDRYVFSDSQLCEQTTEETPKPLDEVEPDDIGPQRSRCLICQELLGDLRQKFSVVRDQSSWGDDTNPFCCDRCWESSPLPGPTETEQVAAPPVDDFHCENNSSPWPSDEAGYSIRNPEHPALEEPDVGGKLALAIGVSRLGDDQSSRDGAGLAPSSNSVERGNRSLPTVLPIKSLRSAEEDACAIGSVRGAGMPVDVKGDGANAELPPTQKAEAVAAAFSAHLRGVDKYPLELARLCRFAQFLTKNELLREAYEVILHILSSFAVVASSSSSSSSSNTERAGSSPCCAASMSFSPLPLPPGLNGQLLLVAGRLAVAIGRYPEAVRHVKASVRAATHANNIAARESPAILVSASRVFGYLLDDRSAEIILLGCMLHYPDYKPALSSYGKLAARQGELGVAERYLTRVASFSSGNGTAAKVTECRTRGVEVGCGPAEEWLALTEFYSERWTRAADALACFRKALNCLDWRRLEYSPRAAEQSSLPSLDLTGPLKKTVESPSSSSPSSTENAGSGQPSADTLLAFGRFELLQNRSVTRALSFFKACLKESPWHASAKVHLAVCMLEQLGPVKSDRPLSRTVLRIDSLLRSALNCHFDGHPEKFRATPNTASRPATLATSPSSTSTPQHTRENRAKRLPRMTTAIDCPDNATQPAHPVPSSPPGGSPFSPVLTKESSGGRGAWPLWAFYAKFAERCLKDPRLALYALDRAVAAAAAPSYWGGLVRDRRRGGSNRSSGQSDDRIGGIYSNRGRCASTLALVARAQFFQRWPKLFNGLADSAGGFSGRGVSSPEEIMMDGTKRYLNDPAAHASLGYLLLSKNNNSTSSARDVSDPEGLENLDRAIIAFRRAIYVSQADDAPFVPATRGLAVAVRRRRMITGCAAGEERQPSKGDGDAPSNNNEEESQQDEQTSGEEENPRYLLQSILQEIAGGRVGVALLRTAALHAYAWRASGNTDDGKSPTAAAASVVNNKVADERQAEMLLARAVELEPFHVPTMAALAFMLLQRSGGGGGGGRAMARAEALLEKAIECAGRRVSSDILRTLARVRAYRGRRSSAMSLFRRAAIAAATVDSTDDPLSLCGHAQLLLAPYRRRRLACPLQASPLQHSGQKEDGGQKRSDGCGTVAVAARPETGPIIFPPLMASKKEVPPAGASASEVEEALPLVFPSDKEKGEAARLLARAFSLAGGAMPPETVYFGSQVDDANIKCDDVVERGRAGRGRERMVLAEVHLVVSGFSLKDGWGGGGGCDGAKEWHLREAARVGPPDTKTGIIARYILGRQILVAGDDRKAEILFLEALDAEPTTFGGCAALLSALRQVAVDDFQAKVRLRRLRRCLGKRHKGRRRGVGGAAQKKKFAAHVSQKIEVSKRSVKLLERLQVYASLRKRHAGDLLQGLALTNVDWALALEEGWEARYTRLLEAGDGWAAIHCLQQA